MAKTSVLSLQFIKTVICLLSLSSFPPSLSLDVETQALLDFKSQLKDPLNVLESWKESESPCEFSGITCDPLSGKVTAISFDNQSLSGVISPSISALESLMSLWLPSNAISGKLPDGVINCSKLRVLNLTGNTMVGVMPDLSSLRNLEILDLSENYFSGRFPSWTGNLSGLLALGLGVNEYHVGEIPESIGNLKNLTWLFLANSHLTGEIPESIFELENLQTLDISRNKISGQFPKSISKLRKLTKIELFSNNLTGEIPPELANLTLLQEFDVSSNQLYGKLPEGIGSLKSLTIFQGHQNNFSGEIPAGFGEMHHLNGFSIYQNNFSGEFPTNFGRFSPLNSIDISENQFSGSFPRFLCESKQLQYLLALGNRFSGVLPDSYAGCKTLWRFRVNKNQLTGKIPEGVWAMPLASIIDFSDNDFTGEVSPQIRLSISLNQLILQNNRFSGQLPSELGKLMNLEKLYLNNNNFSGVIPSDIGSLQQLSSLHLEENSLTGSIPSELGDCARVVDLNIASNSLSGRIPITITLMSSLNSLNLSRNKLNGLIPEGLEKLKLSSIDLSENQLSGRVPSVLLTMGGDRAFIGNKELCVDENSKTIINSGIKVCLGRQDQERKFGDKLVLFSIIACVLVFVLTGMLLLSYRNFKHGQAQMKNDLEGKKEGDPKWKISSFHQLDIDADELCDLEEDNLIGCGGTGKVYRLDLKKNRGAVAVKQLWKGDGLKFLEAEMEILGKIRHRNILKLYASLLKGESSFLVFEYMPNELVTGKRPIDEAYGEGKDIAYWVLSHLNDRENILKVLDEEVASESAQEEMIKVLKIGVLCTTKLPNLRPTMREVVKMLVDADSCAYREMAEFASSSLLQTKECLGQCLIMSHWHNWTGTRAGSSPLGTAGFLNSAFWRDSMVGSIGVLAVWGFSTSTPMTTESASVMGQLDGRGSRSPFTTQKVGVAKVEEKEFCNLNFPHK
ncbi:hypothetical protein D5086_033569 [Populus alba]|uniref:Uncharacterized protein n=1 Tax=Populus alba TaxID=43335 RepID=A0ACC4AH63_POPAL